MDDWFSAANLNSALARPGHFQSVATGRKPVVQLVILDRAGRVGIGRIARKLHSDLRTGNRNTRLSLFLRRDVGQNKTTAMKSATGTGRGSIKPPFYRAAQLLAVPRGTRTPALGKR
jgi:hypothetical protein